MITDVTVYWIRKQKHTDLYKQGYIGITHNLNDRMSRHKTGNGRPRDTPIQRAILKYGWDNLIKEILFVGTLEECSDYELMLRPTRGIGWNIAQGGWQGNRMFGEDNPKYGKLGVNAKPITINGIQFKSLKEAAKHYGCGTNTLAHLDGKEFTPTKREVTGREIIAVSYTHLTLPTNREV